MGLLHYKETGGRRVNPEAPYKRTYFVNPERAPPPGTLLSRTTGHRDYFRVSCIWAISCLE